MTRSFGLCLSAAILAFSAAAHAQSVASSQSMSTATSVSAEMTKGKLSPANSKAGDEVMLKLKDDVKSNGEVVLKKGTEIKGVVRKASRVEGKADASAHAQSMMEIEWLVPSAQGGASQSLMVAIQSVSQVSPMSQMRDEEASADVGVAAGGSTRSSGGGGLLGGGLGASTGVVAGVTGTVRSVGVVGGGAASSVNSSASNAAILSMPSVVAADAQTTTALQSTLGMSGRGELFQTGRGQIVTSGGTTQSLEIFSHMNNDTVLTSASRNFEISSGAQMQMLVGVGRKQ